MVATYFKIKIMRGIFMNKKFRTLFCSALLVCSLTTVGASARSIGQLSSFRLPAWQAVVSTGALTKAITNVPWVLNTTSLSNASSVDTYLANSDGDRRSSYTSVGVGKHEINCSGQAGYSYHAVMMNSTSQSATGYLTGSWSPDNK